jgi:hypothetical protein
MGDVGFEPTKAEPPDLQSGPFDHSGNPPTSIPRPNLNSDSGTREPVYRLAGPGTSINSIATQSDSHSDRQPSLSAEKQTPPKNWPEPPRRRIRSLTLHLSQPELAVGVEPTTPGLQNRCSAIELRQQRGRNDRLETPINRRPDSTADDGSRIGHDISTYRCCKQRFPHPASQGRPLEEIATFPLPGE